MSDGQCVKLECGEGKKVTALFMRQISGRLMCDPGSSSVHPQLFLKHSALIVFPLPITSPAICALRGGGGSRLQ